MSKELLKALLNYEFYKTANTKVTEDSFKDNNAKWLFQTIKEHHEKHNKSLNVEEFKALHYAYNPAITSATKASLNILFDEIDKLDISYTVGEELVMAQYNLNQFTELAQLAMDAADNKEASLEKMQQLLDNVKAAAVPPSMEEEYITDDIDQLFDEIAKEYRWKLLPPLQTATGGIGEGVFALIAARPNAGKTGLCAALVCQPGGFASQGAKVHYLGVEEKSVRTKMRAISSYTGWTKEYINNNRIETTKLWNQIKNNFFLKDVVGMNLTELEEYVKLHDIDILIVDQLDKIKVEGSFAGEHDKLRTLYTTTREIAKRYNIAIIGVCQASNDAEGKLKYGFECLENSKTGKAAELDLCITIGKNSFGDGQNDARDDGFRMANIVKNKLTGVEESIGFILQRELSRITT